jgi:hypothetical protein
MWPPLAPQSPQYGIQFQYSGRLNPHQHESLYELGINTNGQTTFWPRHSPYPKTFGLDVQAQSIEKIIDANELREWASGSEMGHG